MLMDLTVKVMWSKSGRRVRMQKI